jgi:hypothetical protein
MTKRDEAVFTKAFDELEAEGYFDELEKELQARELREKARARAKPIQPDPSILAIRSVPCGEFEAAYYRPDSAIIAAMSTPEEPKSKKKSGKKSQASVSSRNPAADKVPLAASKK